MQVLLNTNNEIISYATVGGVDNGIDIVETIIPTDFEELFAPGKYVLENGAILENEAYTPPTAIENFTPNMVEVLQQQNAQLLLNLAKQETNITKLEEQNASIILYLAQNGGGNNVESLGN